MHESRKLSLAMAVLALPSDSLYAGTVSEANRIVLDALKPDKDSIEARYARLIEGVNRFDGPALYTARGWYPRHDGQGNVHFENRDPVKYPSQEAAYRAAAALTLDCDVISGAVEEIVIVSASDGSGAATYVEKPRTHGRLTGIYDAEPVQRNTVGASEGTEPTCDQTEPAPVTYRAYLRVKRTDGYDTQTRGGFSCYEDAFTALRGLIEALPPSASVTEAQINSTDF